MALGRAANRWRASARASVVQVVGTVGSHVVLTGASYVAASRSWTLALLLAVLAGLALVRVFVLQHDCAHRSLFRRATTNDRVGTLLGFLTQAPHAYWRAMHLVHHRTSGDLDRRGVGDIETLTADEYRGLEPRARLRYRLFRHPALLLGIAPILQFLVRFRMPNLVARERRAERRSIALTNTAVLAMHLAVVVLGDWPRWMLVHLAIFQVAAGIGIYLFFVQHQVERPYWVRTGAWSLDDAALQGSSHLVLPRPLEYLVAGINLHHVHHLDPKIPNYHLRTYMEREGLSHAGVRLGLSESLRTFRLKVYDEASGVMTGFPRVACRHPKTHADPQTGRARISLS